MPPPGARPAPMMPCWPPGAAPGRSPSPSASDGAATTFAFADGRPVEPAECRSSRWPRRPRSGRNSSPRCRRGTITGSSPCWPACRSSPSRGDQLAFLQHCHVVRRVLEIGKWLALGHAAPAPVSLHPPRGAPTPGPGRDRRLCAGDRRRHRVPDLLRNTPAAGRDLLCLHTAGADGRQFHRLMADPRITAVASAGGVRPALARQVAAARRRDPRLVAARTPISTSI